MNANWIGKRWWLVGASEGLGRALAAKMSRAGVHLVLSARDETRLAQLAAELPGRAEIVPMDVTDAASVAAAAAQVGEVDGLVWLAGTYWPMTAQAWDVEKAVAMCEVNLTGCVRVLGHVVPQFARRGSGHLVVTGSISGHRGLPGTIGYAASKAGVMELADCIRADLAGTDVLVQTVNPGFIRTRLTDRNAFRMPFIMEPEQAATQIFDHMQTDRAVLDFPGRMAGLFRAGRLLPDRLWYRLTS